MLQFGMIGDALVDLTGGICATMTLRSPTSDSPKKILEFMASGYERGAMIGLGICIGTGTGVSPDSYPQPCGSGGGYKFKNGSF